jgi:hypothetical protein
MSLLSFSPLDIIRKGQAMQHATPRIRVLSSPQHATSAFLAFLVAARSRAAATHHEHRPETHGQRFNPSDRDLLDLLALKLWVGAARHLWGWVQSWHTQAFGGGSGREWENIGRW